MSVASLVSQEKSGGYCISPPATSLSVGPGAAKSVRPGLMEGDFSMLKKPMIALASTLALSMTGAAAQARSLADEADINASLMAIGIADEIRNTCDDIRPRMFRALSTLSALRSKARERGYSSAEIEDYVTSKAEKKKMRVRAEAFLMAAGIDPKDPEQLCAYGRAEIDRKSQIGVLLKK